MDEREVDEELIQQMLDWLSRGMDEDGNFAEEPPPVEMILTDEDHDFLREHKIAIPD